MALNHLEHHGYFFASFASELPRLGHSNYRFHPMRCHRLIMLTIPGEFVYAFRLLMQHGIPSSHKIVLDCLQLAFAAVSSLVLILGEGLAALIKSVIPTDDFIGIVLDPMAWGSMAKTHSKVRCRITILNAILSIYGSYGGEDMKNFFS